MFNKREFRICFLECFEDILLAAHRPPGGVDKPKDELFYQVLKAVVEDDDFRDEFLRTNRGTGTE